MKHQALWQVLLAPEQDPADAWVDQSVPVKACAHCQPVVYITPTVLIKMWDLQ